MVLQPRRQPSSTQIEGVENRVLRGKFGPKDEVTGGWRKLHDKEINNLYCSPAVHRAVLLEKLIAAVNLPAFYGTKRFFIVFTKPYNYFLS
jgi:hypothetical protein